MLISVWLNILNKKTVSRFKYKQISKFVGLFSKLKDFSDFYLIWFEVSFHFDESWEIFLTNSDKIMKENLNKCLIW